MKLKNIEQALDEIFKLSIKKTFKISDWRFKTARYNSPEDYHYHDQAWQPIEEGDHWPTDKEVTVFFKTSFTIPEELREETLYFDFNIGGEALLRINNKPYHGLDDNHRLVKIREELKDEEELEILIEAGINRKNYEFQYRYWSKTDYQEHIFKRARVVIINKEIEKYYFDLDLAVEICRHLKNQELKKHYLQIIKQSFREVNLIGDKKQLLHSIRKAARNLNNGIKNLVYHQSNLTCNLLGHAHIDIGYLWPVKETIRKASRTFSTTLHLMDEYQDYKFIQSQPLLYRFIKEFYPEIYQDIQNKIKEGQWEVEGAMWVEPDCNLPSGESLIRQILYGKQFIKDEFDKDSKIAWLPDTFGFTWTLPQILAGCGIKYFVTQKINWSRTNEFPYSLFKWKGPDGSEVLSLISGSYNGHLSTKEINERYKQFKQKELSNDYLHLYGYGDGGGGVTRRMLERVKRLNTFNKNVVFRTNFVSDMFDKIDSEIKDEELPVWDDELYLEAHRGTYTSHALLKKLNRRCERELRDAEFYLSITKADRQEYLDSLKEAWLKVLTNQFHDILPGSSIKRVFTDAVVEYKEALEVASFIKNKALKTILPICVNDIKENDEFNVICSNTLSWQRNDIAKIDIGKKRGKYNYTVVDGKGETIPCQVSNRDSSRDLMFSVNLPSMGFKQYTVKRESVQTLTAESFQFNNEIENNYFVLDFNSNGELTGIYDKINKRQILTGDRPANVLQVFEDRPTEYDAWEIENPDGLKRYDNFQLEKIELVENGDVCQVVRVIRGWNNSTVKQNIITYQNIPRIDFETEVEWYEDRKLLKVAFPVDIRSREATYDIAYGTIKRPTHENTSWEQAKFEVPGHMWCDLSEYGYGVSLLNDCKYGYDIKDNVIRLTLLKSPINPNPEADRGKHKFTYSLYPHTSSWQQGETGKQAYQLNSPVVSVISKNEEVKMPEESIFKIDKDNVSLEAIKPAEDGNGIIIRLLEKHGIRDNVNIECNLPGQSLEKVYLCNMVEEVKSQVILEDNRFKFEFKPYQIITFRLIV